MPHDIHLVGGRFYEGQHLTIIIRFGIMRLLHVSKVLIIVLVYYVVIVLILFVPISEDDAIGV